MTREVHLVFEVRLSIFEKQKSILNNVKNLNHKNHKSQPQEH